MPNTTEVLSSPLSLNNFERVAAGELDCHVWRSRLDPTTLVEAVFVEPCAHTDLDLDLSVHVSLDPYYDGLLPANEAIARGQAQRAATYDHVGEING